MKKKKRNNFKVSLFKPSENSSKIWRRESVDWLELNHISTDFCKLLPPLVDEPTLKVSKSLPKKESISERVIEKPVTYQSVSKAHPPVHEDGPGGTLASGRLRSCREAFSTCRF